MKPNRTTVSVGVQFDGIHNWEEAPNFLKNPHQHRFRVQLRVETIPGDNSRHLEFFEVKSALLEAIEKAFPDKDPLGARNLGGLSTEAISDRIHDYLPADLQRRPHRIGVYEDDSQGSESDYEPEEPDVVDSALYTQGEISSRVAEVGRQITNDFSDVGDLTVVCVLKGAFVFAADLIRKIDHPNLDVEFVRVRSYDGQEKGNLELLGDFPSLQGRHVLVVDDICDSGETLAFAIDRCWDAGAETVEATVLLRRDRKDAPLLAKYFGFLLVDGSFVYGYGLDLDEKHRHLPFLSAAS